VHLWSESDKQPMIKSVPVKPSAREARLSILIIDDNYEYSDSLRFLLEFLGHQADTAPDGPTGLSMATSRKYDGIVCDIGLPGLDGYEVARRLRSMESTVRTPLIAVTAYGSLDAKRQSFAAGFDAHLVKPAAVQDILSHLGAKVPDELA
jgi:two-component system, sensor histidine kinase